MSKELIISNLINQLNDLESKNYGSSELMEKTKILIKQYNICRIDIKNEKTEKNSVSIINCSDDAAKINKPKWFKKPNGEGTVVQSEQGSVNLDFICVNEGELIFTFRGVDYKNEDKVRLPIYVECTKISINDKDILDESIFISHDNFYRYRMNVNNGQKIRLEIHWNLFNNPGSFKNELTTKDFNNQLNNLNKQFNNFKKETTEILDSHYNLFNTLLKYYELKPKGVMEKIQLLNLELINFIGNVCKKFDLQYWIDCGTLLGALRHGDFIPWDDDIDLGMMRKDYETLLKVLKQEVKQNNLDKYITVERMDRVNNNNYLISFMKLSFRVNHTLFGFIDIFPFDYRHTNEGINEKIYMSERNLFLKKVSEGNDKRKAFDESYKKLELTGNISEFIIPGIDSPRIPDWGFEIFKRDMIFPLKSIKVKNNYYPCPNKSDEYLKMIYGDYMNIPKIIKTHGLIDLKRNVDDEEKVFDMVINEMKKINQKY